MNTKNIDIKNINMRSKVENDICLKIDLKEFQRKTNLLIFCTCPKTGDKS